MTDTELEEGLKAENSKILNVFMDGLNVDEEFAQALSDAGFSSLEEVAYVPTEELTAIEGLDEETAKQLQQNALASVEKKAQEKQEAGLEELTKLEGIDRVLAARLVAKGIKSGEELADQAIDDLTDIEGLDEKKAGEIIMAARNEYWFKDQSEAVAKK